MSTKPMTEVFEHASSHWLLSYVQAYLILEFGLKDRLDRREE